MARRSNRPAPKPELFERIPVEDYSVRDQDGWKIARGHAVRRLPRYSPTLQCEVPGVVGIVEDIFQRQPNGPVILSLRLDRDSCASGLASADVRHCKRSEAVIRGTDEQGWHGVTK